MSDFRCTTKPWNNFETQNLQDFVSLVSDLNFSYRTSLTGLTQQNLANRTYQTEVLSYMPCHSDVCVDLESWERELEREFVSQLHAVVESIWKQVEHVSFVVLEKGCECREKKSLRYRTHKTTMKAIRREEEEIEFDFGWSNLFFLVMFLFYFSRLPYTAVVERWWETKCIANQNLLKWW